MKNKILYKKFILIWIQHHQQFIKESTYYNYQNIIDNHLIRDLGDLELKQFNNNLLQKYVITKLEKGSIDNSALAIKSVKDIMVVLKLSLRYAFSNNYIKSFDLAIKYPKVTVNNKIMIIADKDIRKIVNYIYANGTPKNYGILIALLTGLRIGELCALKFSDISFETNIIHVNRTLQRIYNKKNKTKVIESTPKTISSFRTIPITKEIKDIIVKKNNSNNYVLSRNNKPIEPRMLRKEFNNILIKNKIKHYKFHSLRHTFATKCIEANIDYKTISVLLGHSNINTTLNLYVHPNNG